MVISFVYALFPERSTDISTVRLSGKYTEPLPWLKHGQPPGTAPAQQAARLPLTAMISEAPDTADPGEGVPEADPGGPNRANLPLRSGTEAKIASPPQPLSPWG